MSLRRKMTLQIAAMIVGLLLISAAALWGLNGLHQDYGLALAGYRELREVYGEVGSHLATARELLSAAPGDRARAAEQIELASQKFDLFQADRRGDPDDDPRDDQAEADLRAALTTAATQLRTPPGSQPEI